MPRSALFLLLCLALPVCNPESSPAQELSLYTRRNTIDFFTEYANNSSHILLGEARDRKLLTFGAGYSRRILLRRSLDLQYRAELRPVVFESDPLDSTTSIFTPNSNAPPNLPASSYSYSYRQSTPCISGLISTGPVIYQGVDVGTETYTNACSRRVYTYGQAFSPAGLKLNLLPRSPIQPVFTLLGGYLFTTQPIPVDGAGSFNFTFEFGAGLELYRTLPTSRTFFANRSLRLEYRYHHISNKNTARQNPGIDSGLFQLTYAFGR